MSDDQPESQVVDEAPPKPRKTRRKRQPTPPSVKGYYTSTGRKLHDGLSGKTYYPRSSGRIATPGDANDNWLKVQIEAGLVEEA